MNVMLPVTLSLGILLLSSRVCVLQERGGEGRSEAGEIQGGREVGRQRLGRVQGKGDRKIGKERNRCFCGLAESQQKQATVV